MGGIALSRHEAACVRGVGRDEERNLLPLLRRQILDELAAGGGNIGAGVVVLTSRRMMKFATPTRSIGAASPSLQPTIERLAEVIGADRRLRRNIAAGI